MKKIKVISRKNLPMPLPVGPTIVVWLLLDRLKSPSWVWGAVGTVVAFLWLIAFIHICGLEEKVELSELSSDADNFEMDKRVARAMARGAGHKQ